MTRDDVGRAWAVLVGVVGLIVWAVLPAFGVGPVVSPGTCTATWEQAPTNTNGTPLTDLARWEIQVGTAPGVYPTPPVAVGATSPAPGPGLVISWPCVGVTDGQRYARVRAVDLAGNPSAWSAEAPFLFDAVPPAAPTNLRIGS